MAKQSFIDAIQEPTVDPVGITPAEAEKIRKRIAEYERTGVAIPHAEVLRKVRARLARSKKTPR